MRCSPDQKKSVEDHGSEEREENAMTTAAMSFKSSSPAEASRSLERRGDMILQQLQQLPTLPAVVVRLMELTASDESSARQVVALIASDPALTAKMLRLAHRAHMGAPNVTTVDRAVLLLGFEQVRNAVLSIHAFQALRGAEGSDGLLSGLWRHALAVACAARELAMRLPDRPVSPDEAFVCGLLHDAGKLALASTLPKTYARVVRRAEVDYLCICDVERELMGIDHMVAGRRLLLHWRMPPLIVECAWLHHHPPEALPASVQSPKMIEVVHLADRIARGAGIGYSGYHDVDGDLNTLAIHLGLDPAVIENVLLALPERMSALSETLGLQPVSSNTVTQAVSEANDELGRINGRLMEETGALRGRARCFDALARMVAASRPDDPPDRTCSLAAQAIAESLGADAVIVVTSYDVRQRYVGAWDIQRGARSRLLPVVGAPRKDELQDTIASALPRCCTKDDIEAWTLFFPGNVSADLVVLPLVHQGEVIGVAVVALPESMRRGWSETAHEWVAFSGMMAFALRRAFAQLNAVRLQEQLSDANRRLQAAQGEVLRRRSLSMIAEMAAGAAHELNNPLAIIAGRAQMLARDCQDAEQQRILGIISDQARRASDIVSELMAFAKPQTPKPIPITLGSLLQMLYQQWTGQSSLGPEQLEVCVADPDVAILADPTYVTQVFNAILSNAVQATTPQTAHIFINSTSVASDETVRIRIEDNGTGMSHDVLERACDPFFSYRTAGRGRGLGLSKAQRLMDLSGGRLRLESHPGKGTTVHLEFPAAWTGRRA